MFISIVLLLYKYVFFFFLLVQNNEHVEPMNRFIQLKVIVELKYKMRF